MSFSHSLPLNAFAQAANEFVAHVCMKAPCRVEAKVSSCNGMPLLCAVEDVLRGGLARPTAQELVWLSGAPRPDAHVLHLQAFGPGNQVIAERMHEFGSAPVAEQL